MLNKYRSDGLFGRSAPKSLLGKRGGGGSSWPRASTRDVLLYAVIAAAVLYIMVFAYIHNHHAEHALPDIDAADGVDASHLGMSLKMQHGSASGLDGQHAAQGGLPATGGLNLGSAKHRGAYANEQDASPRCKASGICDGKHDCGEDGLGCITDAAQRRDRVRDAIKWSWKGYK